MTVVGMSRITSKGQVTLPSAVRKLLKLDKGKTVAFCLDKAGIFISQCKIDIEPAAFSQEEWRKIEKLANAKGKIYNSAEEAKKHIRSL